MRTTKCLREEHQVILRVLGFFETALDRASRSDEVSLEAFDAFVTFFRGFADHCHHCKEESRLFPALVRVGLPKRQGPIAVMLHEHEQGRALVRHMKANLESANRGDDTAKKKVLAAGREFLILLRNHIHKEDHVLFDMADGMIRGQASDSLLAGYEAEEQDATYSETYRSCSRIVSDLAKLYEAPSEP